MGSSITETLEAYEKRWRAIDIQAWRAAPGFKELCTFCGVAFLSTPFFLITFLFVPVLGQILVGLSLLLSITYFRLRRSWKITAAWSMGAIMSAILIALTAQPLRYSLDFVLFVLLALGIPYCLAYCAFIGVRIWGLQNPGAPTSAAAHDGHSS